MWVDDWRDNAATLLPWNAWANATSVGDTLATTLQPCAYQHIHFIAHSAGSRLIDTTARWLKLAMGKAITIHETFLDAYDPSARSYAEVTGVDVLGPCPSQGYCEFNKDFSTYGELSDWADNYVDTRQLVLAASEPLDYTKLHMQGAYNVDVTPQEGDDCGVVDPYCVHKWPYRYYQSTIGAPTSSLGFPLSREAGQPLWAQGSMQDQYPRGAGIHISTPGWQSPPKEVKAIYVPMSSTPGVGGFVVDEFGEAQCIVGVLTIPCSQIQLTSGASPSAARLQSQSRSAAAATAPTHTPAWLVMQIQTDQLINTLRFNWRFAAGGEGLLRVFVNENLVRYIDQRHVPAVSPEPVSLYIRDLAPGTYKIAFRLDGYGANPSGVDLTDVQLGRQTLVVENNLLTVAKVGSGSGTVTSNPTGIDCGATCAASFDTVTSVTLTASPADGSTFAGWTPPSCGSPFTLTADTTCTATFNLANRPPVADAGPDQTVRLGSLVTLDGGKSADPDSGPSSSLSFAWTRTAGPNVALTGTNSAKPTFTPTVKGAYTFSLTVNDGAANSAPDEVTITVPALGDIDGDGDVDQNDVNLVTATLNTPANGPNDLRDINGDMKIDALDARKLVNLCTRPRCATQ